MGVSFNRSDRSLHKMALAFAAGDTAMACRRYSTQKNARTPAQRNWPTGVQHEQHSTRQQAVLPVT